MKDFEKIYFRKDAVALSKVDIPSPLKEVWGLHWKGNLFQSRNKYSALNLEHFSPRLRALAEADGRLLGVKLGDGYPQNPKHWRPLSASFVSAYAQFLWAFFHNHSRVWPALRSMLIVSLFVPSAGLTRMTIFLMGHLAAIRGHSIIGFWSAYLAYHSIVRSLKTNYFQATQFCRNIVLAAFPYTYLASARLNSPIEPVILNGETHLTQDPYYRSIFQVSALYVHSYTGDIVRAEIYSDRLSEHHKKGVLLRYRPVARIMALLPVALRGYGYLVEKEFLKILAEHNSEQTETLINSQFFRVAAVLSLHLGKKDAALDLIEKASEFRKQTRSFQVWKKFDDRVKELSRSEIPFNPLIDKLFIVSRDFDFPPNFTKFFIGMVHSLAEAFARGSDWFINSVIALLRVHLECENVIVESQVLDSRILHPTIKIATKYVTFMNLPQGRQMNTRKLLSALSPIISTFLSVIEEHNRVQNLESNATRVNLANQVAHDIRSPLAALSIAAHALGDIPEKNRLLISMSITRIQDIANGLLENNRTKTVHSEPKFSVYNLAVLIDSIVAEKRVQYQHLKNVEIAAMLDSQNIGLFASVDQVEFKRMLSNLLNNAVEAVRDEGKITIGLTSFEDQIIIRVMDSGKGFPPELFSKLGDIGASYGKAKGNGLGLPHAKKTVESVGGKFEIESALGKGTIIRITIPLAGHPPWFATSIFLAPTVLVLDDDPTIHEIWRQKLHPFNINLLNFHSIDEMSYWVRAKRHHGKELFLLDHDIRGNSKSGLDLAEELNLNEQSLLVTNRHDDPSIHQRCAKLGMKVLPKMLVEHARIVV